MTAAPESGDTHARSLRQRIGSHYRSTVPPIERKIPQHTFAMENDIWRRCLRIAKIRNETMSQLIRQYCIRYDARYRHLLDDE
jgi:hypothetical protein